MGSSIPAYIWYHFWPYIALQAPWLINTTAAIPNTICSNMLSYCYLDCYSCTLRILLKYTYYSRIFQIALYIAVPLLLITLIFGLNLNEAKRVLPLPFNLTFQTSDLAKVTLIIYLARMLTKKQEQIKDFKSAFVPLMLPVLIVTGLIFPANFSTAALLFVTSLVLIFIGRVKVTLYPWYGRHWCGCACHRNSCTVRDAC